MKTLESQPTCGAAVCSSDLLDGLCVDKFDSGWRACSEIQRCSVTELDAFVKAHYLGKRPAIVLLALKMQVRNLPVGMVIYSARSEEHTSELQSH